jgi:hypothetical protein
MPAEHPRGGGGGSDGRSDRGNAEVEDETENRGDGMRNIGERKRIRKSLERDIFNKSVPVSRDISPAKRQERLLERKR